MIKVEPEHCGRCERSRNLKTCQMCGARMCRFCQGPHVEEHDNNFFREYCGICDVEGHSADILHAGYEGE